MKYRIIITACLILFTASVFMSFQTEESEEAIIQKMMDEELAKRLDEYRKAREFHCRKGILNMADRKADSIVLALAREDFRIDSVPRPDVPERPERPEIRQPRDTTPVAPLLPVDSIEIGNDF